MIVHTHTHTHTIAVGDSVTEDEVIAEIETDKVNYSTVIWVSGIVVCSFCFVSTYSYLIASC